MAELKHRQPGVQIDVETDSYRSTSQSTGFFESQGGLATASKFQSKIESVEVNASENDCSAENRPENVESLDDLREQLRTMKEMMEEIQTEKGEPDFKKPRLNKDSPIDGSFLSVVFGVVLTMILSVSFYAFQNLYYAILKKFPGNSTS